jgi:hypothetical protein
MADTNDKITSGILGLGGAPVPKEPTDPSAENDPESIARRRSRMREAEDEQVQSEAADRQRSGATGIDMGAGGQGTDISRD